MYILNINFFIFFGDQALKKNQVNKKVKHLHLFLFYELFQEII